MSDVSHLHPEGDFGSRVHAPRHRTSEEGRLRLVLGITFVTMLAEFFGGLWTGSVALTADAGHMFSHLLALGTAYVAMRFSARPATAEGTFGYHRAEMIAAFFNAVTILGISLLIVVEAFRKLLFPAPVRVVEMLAIAAIGLVVNLFSAAVLMRNEHKEDLNMRGAVLHLLQDTFSSVAIVAGALLIWRGGTVRIDPLLSIVIAAVIGWWGVSLLCGTVRVLMERPPAGMDLSTVAKDLREIGGVREVHDLHVWELVPGQVFLTAHLLVPDVPLSECDRIKDAANRMLAARHGVSHTTFQFEAAE